MTPKILNIHMTVNYITIKVKLFAIYQEVFQQEEIELKLPQKSQAKDIFQIIIAQHTQLSAWKSITKLAVNLDFVSGDFVLHDGDEVALIPPVSGGINKCLYFY